MADRDIRRELQAETGSVPDLLWDVVQDVGWESDVESGDMTVSELAARVREIRRTPDIPHRGSEIEPAPERLTDATIKRGYLLGKIYERIAAAESEVIQLRDSISNRPSPAEIFRMGPATAPRGRVLVQSRRDPRSIHIRRQGASNGQCTGWWNARRGRARS